MRIGYVIVLILCLFSPASSFAQPGHDYVFSDETKLLKLNTQVEVFRDTKGDMGILDVVNQSFENISADNLNFGITSDRIWIRFRITNATENEQLFLIIDQPSLDKISLYTTIDSKRWLNYNLGEYKSFGKRFNGNPNYVFPITLPANASKEIYMSVKSKDQIQLPIFVGTSKGAGDRKSDQTFIFGMYIGIILIMAAYHFFIYLTVNKVSYLYYILYILCVGLVQMNFKGYAFKYLWPESPWIALNTTFILPMFSGLTTALFVKRFLYTRHFVPKLDMGINLYMWLCIFAAIIGLAGFSVLGVQILQMIALIGGIYALIVAFAVVRKKYRPAKFFLFAFAIFFLSLIVFVLVNFDVLPHTLITANILEIGSAIQITLLSFALADEINIYRREKEESQAQAYETLKENERIIKEQNVILESEVKIRTADLSRSNDELQKLLFDLKQTQTQLVEAEKLASLGMLTAGIAHEINNPINFVTSNIAPLRRDIQEVFETLAGIESIGGTEGSVEEKQAAIRSLKLQYDIDYVREEIEMLMTGIEEGANRTAGIVKSLSIFSRVDEYDLKLADINLGMKSTLVILNSSFKDTVEVRTHYGDLPLIECYPGKLNQVFLNLLTNASYAIEKRFGNQPGGVLEITTELRDDHVYVHVKDNGEGIEEGLRSKIFDPFFTTKDVGEGTGLGLSIAHQTILKHQGEITVESTMGEGAEFIIKLPLQQDDTLN